MATKDSLYMQNKKMALCLICEYAAYDARDEKGWNCNNRNSRHFTRSYDLPISQIKSCDVFQFATNSCQKWVEHEIKKIEAKAQTTLGDF